MVSDRWRRFDTLRKSGDLQGLLDFLSEPEVAQRRGLRSDVLFSISESSDPAATAALIDAYKRDPSEGNRRIAAYLLSERHGPEVEPVLIDALDDDNPTIRIHAARGLGRTGSERAIAALSAALNDPRGGVRQDVVSALGRIGGPDVVEPLTRALEDKRLLVRLRATRNLASIGAKSALPAMRRARDRTWPPWRFFMSNDIRSLENQVV